jgi:tRNA(adenine34) deaminase
LLLEALPVLPRNLVQEPRLNHRVEVTSGVMRDECSAMLKEFFAALRQGA